MEVFAAPIPCPNDCRGSWGINQTWDHLSSTCHSTCSRAFLLLLCCFVVSCQSAKILLRSKTLLSAIRIVTSPNSCELSGGTSAPRLAIFLLISDGRTCFSHYIKPGRGPRPRPDTKNKSLSRQNANVGATLHPAILHLTSGPRFDFTPGVNCL